mmetsp:Transcript_32847/g.104765  ORF Transcript_32847/g.104765 Transcript_32847/m.104765 type:complete len:205 (-) Transcript_32847:330-944(-)
MTFFDTPTGSPASRRRRPRPAPTPPPSAASFLTPEEKRGLLLRAQHTTSELLRSSFFATTCLHPRKKKARPRFRQQKEAALVGNLGRNDGLEAGDAEQPGVVDPYGSDRGVHRGVVEGERGGGRKSDAESRRRRHDWQSRLCECRGPAARRLKFRPRPRARGGGPEARHVPRLGAPGLHRVERGAAIEFESLRHSKSRVDRVPR